jgi:Ice-binding-like/Bacterial Ig-like domain
MRFLPTATLVALMSLPPACGEQLVEFGLGDDNGPGSDAGTSTGTPPTVVATGPSNAATNVSINKQIAATFSRAMAPATINDATFTVRQGATAISGTISYSDSTATFTPKKLLDLSLEYTGTITTGAKDPDGHALAANYVWTFTTGACSQAFVPLGSAGGLAILAGSTVTSTGATSVTGDLGVSPGTAVTGFPPGILVGAQHTGDPTSAQAMGDLTTAYNDAAGRTLCPVTVAGNLGGQTLVPGLYKSTSSLEITSGDLTLDAQGDPDAVFLFQMASTLTTTTGRQVILSGGAKAGNVFWQVGSSATLGTGSIVKGTIMADQAITMGTGATLNGRALARIAGVSLDANAIVMPAP